MKKTKTQRYALVFPVYMLLCYGQSAAMAQQNNPQYSPNIQIDTSVLQELSKQMESGGSAQTHRAPTILTPPSDNSSGMTSRYSTNKETPSNKVDDYFIVPDTKTKTTPKTIEKAIDITAPPPKIIAVKSAPPPIPARKPVAAIEQAKAEQIKDIPVPQRRPNIQTASRSFVAQTRKNFANGNNFAASSVRKTIPADPLILKDAPVSMPAERARPVTIEPLIQKGAMVVAHIQNQPAAPETVKPKNIKTAPIPSQALKASAPEKGSLGERLQTHKNRIIEAVQKIAGLNNEPKVEETIKQARQQHMQQQETQIPVIERIEAQSLKNHPIKGTTASEAATIEPAAGTAAQKSIQSAVNEQTVKNGNVISISFENSDEDINADTQLRINAYVLPKLQANPKTRIQLQSYAQSTGEENSLKARRTSLSRALAARKYIVAMGIEPQRIDIRPLGTNNDGGPADRIDFLIFIPKAL